jgi:hypothetical protein
VKIVMEKMRYLYGQFIETVARGRSVAGLTVARVDEMGPRPGVDGALAAVERAWSISWAARRRDRRGGALAGIPLGRDRMPEVHVLPRAPLDLVRRLAAGATDERAAAPATIEPARLLTPEVRAALRMLAPTLLTGGTGVQARLPYEIDIR